MRRPVVFWFEFRTLSFSQEACGDSGCESASKRASDQAVAAQRQKQPTFKLQSIPRLCACGHAAVSFDVRLP